MATKKYQVLGVLWTEEEKILAEKMLLEYKKYDPRLGFIARMTKVSQSFGYSGYYDIPEGVRRCISSIGGKSSSNKRRIKKPEGLKNKNFSLFKIR